MGGYGYGSCLPSTTVGMMLYCNSLLLSPPIISAVGSESEKRRCVHVDNSSSQSVCSVWKERQIHPCSRWQKKVPFRDSAVEKEAIHPINGTDAQNNVTMIALILEV